MFCTHCGNQISEKAVYCVHCGVFFNGCPQFKTELAAQQGKQPEVKFQQSKNINGLSIAGFTLAIVSIALGMLFVYIHVYQYVGAYLQFYCAIPLAVALGLSIAGTVKAKRQKSGIGLGVAGICISGGVFAGAVLYFVFELLMTYAVVLVIMFLLAML